MPKNILKKYFILLVIPIVLFLFMGRLFFPPSIFITPDFGRSDILHSNLPAKLVLSQNLKNFSLPLWESKIGQGFPLMAEGVMGALYPPNLLIFALLPFKFAIPTTYLLTYLLAAFGVYTLCRFLKLSKSAGLLAAISYSFCASLMLHVQHMNFIQAASVLPWCLLTLLNLQKKPNPRSLGLCTLTLAMLFLTGFVQIWVYALIIFALVIISLSFFSKEGHQKTVFFFFLASVMLSLAISALQLYPSLELLKQSERQSGAQTTEVLSRFPLNVKNFLTLIDPFILGSAKDGTYNYLDFARYGIYWESTINIGIIGLLFSLFGIFYAFLKNKKNIYWIFSATLVISILLSLGKNSPTHILFSLPPLSFFRVPGRFIIFTQLFAVILAAYGLDQVLKSKRFVKKQYIFVFFPIFASINLFFYWWNYNPIKPISFWQDKPETSNVIKDDQNYRIYTIANPKNWNDVFVKAGWANKLDYYKFFENAQDQNLNLVYGNSQLAMFETLPTRRFFSQQGYINNGIKIVDSKIEIEHKTKDLLDFVSTKYLISTMPIDNPNYKELLKTSKENYSYFVYESDSPKPRFSIYYDWAKITSLADYAQKINELDITKTVLLEKDIQKKFAEAKNSIVVEKSADTHIKLQVETNKQGILVTTDTYYPGWRAKVNSKEAEILAANLNSRALIIPAGRSTIEFIYKPKYLKLAATISLLSIIFTVFLLTRKEHS